MTQPARVTSSTQIARDAPSHWRRVRLGDVCRVVGGSTPRSGESAFWSGDIIWITPTDLGQLAVPAITDSARRITKDGYESCGTEMLPVGAVVMSSRAPIGHLGIAAVPLCTNQGCKSFVPGPEIDSTFLLHLLRSRIEQMRAIGSGATFAEVSKTQLQNFPLEIPTISEQKRIAARLNEQLAIIERAKLAAEERFRAAKALAAAYVMREFGNGQSKQWPRKTLKALSLGNGQYGTSQKSHPTEAPGTVPVLGIGNIKGGAVVWHRLKFTSLSPQDAVKYRLEVGDLLFCRTNSADLVGETAVFDGVRAAAFASYLVRFRVSPDLADPRFISVYINSPSGRHFIQQNLSRAIGQANVSASVVAEMVIPTPPVAVQRGIMDRLARATAAAGQLAQQIWEELDAIDRMPDALLRAAFEGAT